MRIGGAPGPPCPLKPPPKHTAQFRTLTHVLAPRKLYGGSWSVLSPQPSASPLGSALRNWPQPSDGASRELAQPTTSTFS